MTKDTELTKENVALILEAAGFELHRENPEGRIIFFDPMSELELQYWFTDKKVSDLMSWIRQLIEVLEHTRLNVPITSVRRGITTLTDAGYLVKTNEMREGQYGMTNHCWRYAR